MVPPIATAFGRTTSSPLFVLTFVDSRPTAVTVPSVSPAADVLAGLDGTGEREEESAHHLSDEPARSDRQHHADEHADALERVGVGAGQVGIRHDHREQPEQAGQQTLARLGGVGMNPRHLDPAFGDAVERRLHDADDDARQQDDDGDVEQTLGSRSGCLCRCARTPARGKPRASHPMAACTGRGPAPKSATGRPRTGPEPQPSLGCRAATRR